MSQSSTFQCSELPELILSWSQLNKAEELGLKGKTKLGQYSDGKLATEAESPKFSRKVSHSDADGAYSKRNESTLKADLFAGSDKVVSAGNTYGLIKLTVHEAKLHTALRFCAVVSIGVQVGVM